MANTFKSPKSFPSLFDEFSKSRNSFTEKGQSITDVEVVEVSFFFRFGLIEFM